MHTFYFNNDTCICISFNVIYMCWYLHVFFYLKRFTSVSCYIYFVQDYITSYVYILPSNDLWSHFNIIYMCLYLKNISFMLYLFYTGPDYTICLHFTWTTHGTHILNIIHMYFYLKLLTPISCCIYFVGVILYNMPTFYFNKNRCIYLILI